MEPRLLSHLVLTSWKHLATVVDAWQGTEVRRIQAEAQVSTASYGPDGSKLLVVARDCALSVVEVDGFYRASALHRPVFAPRPVEPPAAAESP